MHSRQTELRESTITGKGAGGGREHDMTHISPPYTCALSWVPSSRQEPTVYSHSQRESWQVSSQKPPGHFLSLAPTSNQSQTPLVLPQKYLQSPLPWASTASMGTLAISHPGPGLCLITNSPLSILPHLPEEPDCKSNHMVPIAH